MIEGIPKISVIIICYKQEELIKRAIDSLLAQKDYIYEICVSDDCSPDRTWEVLQEYDKQYPGLFKLHQNNPNVGIFENIEYTWSMPTGDIIYRLAGDDECGAGWFKTVIEFIQNNHIDYKNELFCIYGDYQAKYPNGDYYIASNRAVTLGLDCVSLALRNKVFNRSACYNIRILQKFLKVSKGRSYEVESAMDRQLQIISQKNYYIPVVGNVYYAQVGVSANMSSKLIEQRLRSMDRLREVMDYFGYSITNKDEILMSYITERERLAINKTIKQYLNVLNLYFASRDYASGKSDFNFKRVIFAIVRRIPHKKNIKWHI